ncbi:hypothetical protein [Soonwooa sp.]|uniref:LA_2272 family surface repeat-containing protein n=1 Tax=Soonwooa sp. TaxID=1938592 RepID=UPI002637A7BB|nr:hypothetical protein [Soonwooa sp.]
MKTYFFILITIFASLTVFGQEVTSSGGGASKIIAFTPLSSNISEVNGLAVGIGLDGDFSPKSKNFQTINGLNLDVNPLGFLMICFYDTSKAQNTITKAQVNGLSLSLAGNLRDVSNSGVGISMYNYGMNMNGAFVSLVSNDVEELNGLGVSIFGNHASSGRGLHVGGFNSADDFKGMQIGVYNHMQTGFGIQIGLVNISKSTSGLQLGFWNRNGKRTMPFINF